MKYIKEIKVKSVAIPITRVCNRRCPECGTRDTLTWYNKSITKKEMELEEIKFVGDTIGKVDKIEITGGEPTLHSKFEELSLNLKSYFQCDDIWLITAGFLFKRDPSKLKLLLNFNNVYVTHYTDDFVGNHGGSNNTEEVAIISNFLQSNPTTKFHLVTMDAHIEHLPPYKGNPCHLAYNGCISYYEGKLYGCCSAAGQLDKGIGLPLTPNWREHTDEMELPCKNCFIST